MRLQFYQVSNVKCHESHAFRCDYQIKLAHHSQRSQEGNTQNCNSCSKMVIRINFVRRSLASINNSAPTMFIVPKRTKIEVEKLKKERKKNRKIRFSDENVILFTARCERAPNMFTCHLPSSSSSSSSLLRMS